MPWQPSRHQWFRRSGTEHFLNGFNEVVTDDLILPARMPSEQWRWSDRLTAPRRFSGCCQCSEHKQARQQALLPHREPGAVRRHCQQFGVLQHARIEMLGEIDAVGCRTGTVALTSSI